MSLIRYNNRFILFNIGHGSFDDGIAIWFTFRILGVGLELDFSTRTWFVKPKSWRIVVSKFYDPYSTTRIFRSKYANHKLNKEA